MSFLTQPEFYDIFGVIIFAFLTIFSIYTLKTKKIPKKWFWIVLLIIGIAGLIVDGIITYVHFVR